MAGEVRELQYSEGVDVTSPSSNYVVLSGWTHIDDGDSPYTVLNTDWNLTLNGASGAVTANLPTVVGIDGRPYRVWFIDKTNTCKLVPDGSEKIEWEGGQLSEYVASMDDESLTLIADETNSAWRII